MFGLVLTSLCAQAAGAQTVEMLCKNPRREYLVTFDKGDRRFFNKADGDAVEYSVLSVEDTPRKLIVVGLTVNNGPTFRATFKPTKKLEYFENNELMQTDSCR